MPRSKASPRNLLPERKEAGANLWSADYVQRFASENAADGAGQEDDSDDEMSSVGSAQSGEDDEPAGNMDEL